MNYSETPSPLDAEITPADSMWHDVCGLTHPDGECPEDDDPGDDDDCCDDCCGHDETDQGQPSTMGANPDHSTHEEKVR